MLDWFSLVVPLQGTYEFQSSLMYVEHRFLQIISRLFSLTHSMIAVIRPNYCQYGVKHYPINHCTVVDFKSYKAFHNIAILVTCILQNPNNNFFFKNHIRLQLHLEESNRIKRNPLIGNIDHGGIGIIDVQKLHG